MELFSKLTEVYKSYNTKIEKINGFDCFVIINPFGGDNIQVFDDDGILFSFSYQHAHFDYGEDKDENMEYLMDYVNDFLDEKQVVIEFFQGDINLFGGSRYIEDIDSSSGESLLRSFSGDDNSLYEALYKQVKGVSCSCSIRGWNDKDNKDIEFTL